MNSGIVTVETADLIQTVPELGALTDRQLSLVLGFLATGDLEDASNLAGYAGEQGGKVALASKPVADAIQAMLRHETKTTAAVKAYRKMVALVDDPSGKIAFSASKWLLEAAGIGKADDGPGDKPLNEWTQDELMTLLVKLKAAAEADKQPVGTLSAP